MKIAINYKFTDQAFGGGNRFFYDLYCYLLSNKHEVTDNLNDNKIDIILIMDPRHTSPHFTFGIKEIIYYITKINVSTIVVHRINECDERKNTHFMNFHLKLINYYADHTVFIASWLKKLNLWHKKNSHSVILNGVNRNIFYSKKNKKINKKLSIVTHHWGANHLKGFDIYSYLDKLLNNKDFKKKFSFTYIGNLPKNVTFKNSKYIKPLNGKKLADELRKHDIYLTASLNEPGGMHHIEGASCGLPLLFRNSGSLPEYCSGFGIQFESQKDFLKKLIKLSDYYVQHQFQIKNYNRDSNNTSKSYLELFKKLLKNKNSIITKRKFNNLFYNFIVKSIPFI